MEFCSTYNLEVSLPVTHETLQLFVAHMARSVSFKTIKVYLAGLRLWHILKDLPDPTQNLLLSYTIKGIRCQQGDQVRTRLPITTSTLRLLKLRLQGFPSCLQDKRMLWAALSVAFYGFLHSSEFTCQAVNSFDHDRTLLKQDVTLEASRASLRIKTSKTDPFHHGVTVHLAQTGTSTCPVSALTKYLELTKDQPPHRPLFQFASGDLLTRQTLTRVIRDLLASSDYASHSLRIGAATSAAAAGIPEWLIQVLGRWSSQCYLSYIRTPYTTIHSAMTRIATTM